MSATLELLPCPFCGSSRTHKSTRCQSGHGKGFTYYRAGCNDCGALIEAGSYTGDREEHFKALVVQKWNRRHEQGREDVRS
ncbi:MAG: Lar family restriction alleviation protein [Xanthomonadaceae bacterium]|nr:Lar family restriction alleviation protein [Xanthomonadaceae bacterium]